MSKGPRVLCSYILHSSVNSEQCERCILKSTEVCMVIKYSDCLWWTLSFYCKLSRHVMAARLSGLGLFIDSVPPVRFVASWAVTSKVRRSSTSCGGKPVLICILACSLAFHAVINFLMQ